MKKAICNLLILTGALLFMSSGAIAAECSGAWQVLPNHTIGLDGACKILGLDTNQAVCQPGQQYATYCDDTTGGRYRTCQSNVPCNQERSNALNNGELKNDRRSDHRDDYREDKGDQARDCTKWDFTTNRPCPEGKTNRDCQKGCDGI